MNETATAVGQSQVKTYRGATIEELLPQIRAELGPEAVIVRRREGLVGGIGGFFQKQCIEVDARAGGPRIDVYDDGGGSPAAPEAPLEEEIPSCEPHPIRNDAATRDGLTSPAVRRLVGQARPFVDLLEQVSAAPVPVEPEPATAAGPASRRATNLRERMVAAGLGPDLAADVVDSVIGDFAPLAAPGRLRTLVRDELAHRVPVAGAAASGRRAIAVVGPAGAGKTAALAALAIAHAGAGRRVACLAVEPRDGGGALRALVGGAAVAVESLDGPGLAAAVAAADADLILVDTPPTSPGDPAAVAALAAALDGARLAEVHLALRAGTAATAAAELLAGLDALHPNRALLTAAAESDHVGGVLDVAIRSRLPLGYVAGEGTAGIAPADPRALAAKVTR
ncbi:MAG: hypothetical protein BGO11_06435 [Solirubrobacterales bacterium 70-9]|nr:MAG: hypothetical protein BGO11_06435 [Solirubrobacterales bacterium 70-9]